MAIQDLAMAGGISRLVSATHSGTRHSRQVHRSSCTFADLLHHELLGCGAVDSKPPTLLYACAAVGRDIGVSLVHVLLEYSKPCKLKFITKYL